MHLGLVWLNKYETNLYVFHDLKTYPLFLEIIRVYEAWVGRGVYVAQNINSCLEVTNGSQFFAACVDEFCIGSR